MYNTIRVSSVLETEKESMRGGRRSRRPEAFLQGHPTFTSLSIDSRKHFLTLRQPLSEPRGRILERPLCAVSLSLLARTHSVALPRHCLSSTTVRVPLPALIKSLFSPPFSHSLSPAPAPYLSWIGKHARAARGGGLAQRNDAHNAALSICPIFLTEADCSHCSSSYVQRMYINT